MYTDHHDSHASHHAPLSSAVEALDRERVAATLSLPTQPNDDYCNDSTTPEHPSPSTHWVSRYTPTQRQPAHTVPPPHITPCIRELRKPSIAHAPPATSPPPAVRTHSPLTTPRHPCVPTHLAPTTLPRQQPQLYHPTRRMGHTTGDLRNTNTTDELPHTHTHASSPRRPPNTTQSTSTSEYHEPTPAPHKRSHTTTPLARLSHSRPD